MWLSRRDQPKNIIGFTHIPTTHTVFTCTQTRYKKIFIHLHTPHAQNIRFLIFPVSHADFTLSVGQHCAPLYLQPFYKQVVSVTRPFPCAIKMKKKNLKLSCAYYLLQHSCTAVVPRRSSSIMTRVRSWFSATQMTRYTKEGGAKTHTYAHTLYQFASCSH